MKKILGTICFIIAFFVVDNTAKAQYLTYNDFMHITKIKMWSEINEYLSAKGYEYGGSISDTIKIEAGWARNCDRSGFESDGSFTWTYDTGTPNSAIIIREYKKTNSRTYRYHFHSRSAYNTFLQTAKKNGFKFYVEDVGSDYICVIYKRKTNKSSVIERLEFNTSQGGGCHIWYGFENQ